MCRHHNCDNLSRSQNPMEELQVNRFYEKVSIMEDLISSLHEFKNFQSAD